MTPDKTITSEQPLLTRRTSRRARRIARKKRQQKITAAAIMGTLLVAGGGVFAWDQLKPVSALQVSELFPADTQDLRVFAPNIAVKSPKMLENIGSYSKTSVKSEETPYLADFTEDINTFFEFRSSHAWMGTAFAEGVWENNNLTVYAVESGSQAKEFMLSESCPTTFLKNYCGEGKFAVRGNWLVTGTADAVHLHASDNKEKLDKESSLAKETEFTEQTSSLLDGTLALIWTDSKNVTSFLPMGLSDSFPTDARLALAVKPAENGVSIHGSMYKGESDNPIFDKPVISDSVTKLPANTVTAISVANAHEDVKNMLANENSFINTQPEWVSLKDGIVGYGAVLPDDLEKIFGETTTFSLNRGSVGNEVAGTLRMSGSDSSVALKVLSGAAQKSSGITEMYKVREGDDDFLIESHSPVTDGVITDNPLFAKLVGPLDKSIAVAFIDLDNSWALLDSSYELPSSNYDAGVLGINVEQGSSNRVDLTLNWDTEKE
ncbi:MAG: hypothetical protein H9W81_17270 [Enterococcus sp.]|nr:hypothetical protein [Enterococcus sp.]